MPSPKGFFYLQKGNKIIYKAIKHTVDNEMSLAALARLTFPENLLIGQERRVRCLH